MAENSISAIEAPSDKHFKYYQRVITDMFKVPMAAVFLVNEDHQWFRSFAGMEVREASLEASFCIHALERGMLEVPDTLQDSFFRHHGAVGGRPFIRFFMGIALCGLTGEPLATLCIMDTQARHLSQVQRSWLLTFAQLVENRINHDGGLNAAQQLEQYSQHDGPTDLRKEALCMDTLFVPAAEKETVPQWPIESHEAPERLTLKLTERTLLVDVDTAIKTIREPRSHRIAVALDEFSTGHLSLSSLKNLPIDILKIDKTFIDDLPYAPRVVDIVDGVIRIAHDLGMQVIAEGVEHEAQLALLQALGCDVVQDHLFSPPSHG